MPKEEKSVEEIIKEHRKKRKNKDYEVTYDENGNRYVLYKEEWIG